MPSTPTITTLARDGSTATPWAALDFTGIDLPNDGNTFLQIENLSGALGALTATADAQAACEFGTQHDWVAALAVGEGRILGPFPVNQFGSVVSIRFTGTSSAGQQFVRAWRPQRAA